MSLSYLQCVIAVSMPYLCIMGDDKPTMSFIYEAMDQAKQTIMQNVRYHGEHIKIIDARWNDQMHHPLHDTGN